MLRPAINRFGAAATVSIQSQRIEIAPCFPNIWNSWRVETHNINWYRITRKYISQYRQSSEGYEFPSSCYEHPRKKWQEQRMNKLTASTFGGAIGLWRGRRVQLWLEKLRAIEPFPNDFNFSVACNNHREERALADYMYMTKNDVFEAEFTVHDNPEYSWLAASPDGIVKLQSRGVVEIKIPVCEADMSKVEPWKRIPLYYMPQAQGILEITDKDWLDFYVWTRNGSRLFRVYRDVEYWACLKMALSDFWWSHVEPAKEICNEFRVKNPVVELRALKPEPRHELCSYIVYYSKLLVDNSELIGSSVIPKYRRSRRSGLYNSCAYYTSWYLYLFKSNNRLFYCTESSNAVLQKRVKGGKKKASPAAI